MKIAIISDSHMGEAPVWLSSVYERYLEKADALIHCGDITSFSTFTFFLQHPNFIPVRGNCDWDPQMADVPTVRTVSFGRLSIGITHGWGPRPQVPSVVGSAFVSKPDLICFGHTHARFWGVVDGVQLLNPGSLGEGSLALLETDTMSCEFMDV